MSIQTPTETPDSYGQPSVSWSTASTRWARVEPLSGRELFQAQQVRPDISHKVTLRYDDTLAGATTTGTPMGLLLAITCESQSSDTEFTPKHRLLFGERVLEIAWIKNEDERNRMLNVFCVEQK